MGLGKQCELEEASAAKALNDASCKRSGKVERQQAELLPKEIGGSALLGHDASARLSVWARRRSVASGAFIFNARDSIAARSVL